MKFVIVKKVEAKSIKEAIKQEAGEVVNVYVDEEDTPKDCEIKGYGKV